MAFHSECKFLAAARATLFFTARATCTFGAGGHLYFRRWRPLVFSVRATTCLFGAGQLLVFSVLASTSFLGAGGPLVFSALAALATNSE
jgi:hypothetical protein